jgi:outer membrane receptor protein involved in Fe transport
MMRFLFCQNCRAVARNGSTTAVIALWALLAAPAAFGQGSISGTVTDAETGDPLIGVNLIVKGTTQGAATGVDGNYTISGLDASEYTVKVTYVGFETKQITGVAVEDGETTTLDVELSEAVLSTEEEVTVVGENPLINVEQSASVQTVDAEQIETAPMRDVQDVVARQAGVVKDPTGLYIRGGRASETGYVVDGVQAKDPLAGTGFGVDLGANSFSEVSVTTGGIGAQYGDVTSGVVTVQTKSGGNEWSGTFEHKRDNFGGVLDDWKASFNQDLYEFSVGGPIIEDKLHLFTSGQVELTDGHTRFTSDPDSLESSIVGPDFFTPRTGNRWNGLGKLTYTVRPGMKLQASYQRTLSVNQNTQSLQVTGNEAVVEPGYQYAFVRQPEKANTYTHDNNLSYLKWSHVIGDQTYYELQLSRLFTKLRADANGRRWRPPNVDSELDPESIINYPAEIFGNPGPTIPSDTALNVLPGPGFYNNGGLATLFHDHFAEQITLQGSFVRFSADKNNRYEIGFQSKFNDYQWIDIIRPWVGAQVGEGEQTTETNRLGQRSDIWRVKPKRGALYTINQFRYRGLIANLGARLQYWAPGAHVDRLVNNPRAPILDEVRQSYKDDTFELGGLRYKLRLLPKVRVSFPIQENQVLFFNYGHSTKLPHPTFVYTGLDPFYQDRSFFSDLGNPNLDPEVDISYELGLRWQLTTDDALGLTAFWRDKFDFITVTDVVIRDQTGRETTRAFRVNGDFARVRGLEATYTKRIGDWFRGQISGSFSRATGLSSTSNEALQQFLADGDIENTEETPLAWDRPLDVKANVTFTHDREEPWLGVPGLNRFRVYLASTLRSGQRYTPVEFVGCEQHPRTGRRFENPDEGLSRSNCAWRPNYERVSDPSERYSEIGELWWWFDLTLERRLAVGPSDLVFSMEVTNLFNQNNGVIVNPTTGAAYPDVDPSETDFTSGQIRNNPAFDVPNSLRDPRFEDPNTSGLPPFNPARYMPQRHVLFGVSYRF